MPGVRVLSAAACALSLIFCCASAQADVVVGLSASATAGSTQTIPNVTVAAGSGRLLTVGVSTTAGVTITGVSYGGQALLAAGQKLKPGTYLLTVTTLDGAGKPQATARVKFWVLKG